VIGLDLEQPFELFLALTLKMCKNKKNAQLRYIKKIRGLPEENLALMAIMSEILTHQTSSSEK
jgi:hypothetical protein